LVEALRALGVVQAVWDFDRIDATTKLVAAALSFHPIRSEWWGRYQLHSRIQARRRANLRASIERENRPIDALLCWGSWFHPFRDLVDGPPYFNYIDQSRSLAPLEGEPHASSRGRRRSHALQAETYRDSSGILCMSEWARAQTLDAHPSTSARLHTVGWGPCAVDLSAEDHEYPRENIVLHVSNDFRRKGVDFLMATAELVARRVPDVQFLVVGEDSRVTWARDSGPVRFLGTRRGEELASLFRRAKVFFLPHRFDRSPHVLVEAMSAGLPLVASAQGGAVELIVNRGTGACVRVGDIDGYATAILQLLQDEPLRQMQGAAALRVMRANYQWSTVAGRILAIIESVQKARKTHQ